MSFNINSAIQSRTAVLTGISNYSQGSHQVRSLLTMAGWWSIIDGTSTQQVKLTLLLKQSGSVIINNPVTRDVLLVGRAKPDCLEGGTHEETLRPQVNPKVEWLRFKETEVLSRLLKDSRVR